MCLILVAWQVHPSYPLVVAANRDEYFARPTEAAGFWKNSPQVLAGRDGEAGGTWMGITRGGRFAALTNFRDPAQNRSGAPSRGALVADFLTGSRRPQEYLDGVAARGSAYNGYNLLAGDGETLWWSSNMGSGPRQLAPGVYGVSNHLLDTPWPKVGAGKTALAQALDQLPDDRALFTLLRDDGIHPDQHLPQTGIPLDWERLLSSAFVRSPDYGTRGSTVLCMGKDGWISFDEQTWLPGAKPGCRMRYRFKDASPVISSATSPPGTPREGGEGGGGPGLPAHDKTKLRGFRDLRVAVGATSVSLSAPWSGAECRLP